MPNTTRMISAVEAAAIPEHPVARLMPPMSEADFLRLTDSIQAAGNITVPVLVHEGQLVDGRHRVRAAQALGWPVPVRELEDDADVNAVAFGANIARRLLTDSQRAIIGARLVTTTRGRIAGAGDVSQSRAAELVGVSERYVREAAWLLAHGDEQSIDEVWSGVSSLRAVISRLRVVRHAERDRPVLVDQFPENAVSQAVEAAHVPDGDSAVILRAVQFIVANRTDPGGWALSLPAAVRASAVRVLENFSRIAFDVADEDEEEQEAGAVEASETAVPTAELNASQARVRARGRADATRRSEPPLADDDDEAVAEASETAVPTAELNTLSGRAWRDRIHASQARGRADATRRSEPPLAERQRVRRGTGRTPPV